MMQLPIFQVDAFADRVFAGNPAAVVPLPHWIDAGLMQAIAAENNLSETAFIVGEGDHWEIRWFTPSTEVDLCGHATLAAVWVIRHRLSQGVGTVRLESASGQLRVNVDEEERLVLDFPARPPVPGAAELRDALTDALGEEPEVVMTASDVLAVYRNPASVTGMNPDMTRLAGIEARGVIVTAPGDGNYDFISRFFGPRVGVPEDPVTGSAHCTLVPYWAKRLEVTRLRARQVSARGGELACRLVGDRVHIAGHATLYMSGVIDIPEVPVAAGGE
ncbi:PhzF family phenazine biosynthesis protein [Natronospira bacteriovora]|uniref:PhzF family phenazine biosynthesis protein n=1 Tax=Natronospira bacteriovora TaxID=3069753 RepID=A0ABU0W969_9GAMM|nr:PhzF family phenazine biosynthesis protein [Natronospira sp. AB-CW4]MDQ2070586.1 PhzF family phenazine biosynthesis protein [Natronospira sp. AB-CW4]